MGRTLFGIELPIALLILGTIAMLALGQVLFKLAAASVHLGQPRSLISMPLIVAFTIYGVATLMWLVVLSRVSLSVAFPFYGLTFFLVPLFAWIFLNEPIRPQMLVGAAVIILGIYIGSLGIRR